MATWLEDFHQKTDLNRYPVALRTRGGIGYKVGRKIVSNFVGHPVYYLDGKLWKPITLQRHGNGDLEGSDFGWNGSQVTYKKRPLFQPKAVIFNGKRHNLDLKWDGARLVCELPFGTYEVRFTEKGVREWLTIPERVEGLIEFDIPHERKPDGLYKAERHIIGGAYGESFLLTKDMTYPLVIDPDYSADTADGYIRGGPDTYAGSRSTSQSHDTSGSTASIGQILFGGNYYTDRGFFKFDTSGIPDTDSVSDVVIKLTCTADNSNTDFDVQIVKHDWSGEDPIGAGNRETAFDACLAGTLDAVWRNTSGMSTNTQYTSPSLDATRVNKTGNTYYSARSSRDYDNSGMLASNEYIEIATQNNGTSGYRPILTVTHAAPVLSSLGFWKFAQS